LCDHKLFPLIWATEDLWNANDKLNKDDKTAAENDVNSEQKATRAGQSHVAFKRVSQTKQKETNVALNQKYPNYSGGDEGRREGHDGCNWTGWQNAKASNEEKG
jgi:hypothetical protein